jgi:hypothetical protein
MLVMELEQVSGLDLAQVLELELDLVLVLVLVQVLEMVLEMVLDLVLEQVKEQVKELVLEREPVLVSVLALELVQVLEMVLELVWEVELEWDTNGRETKKLRKTCTTRWKFVSLRLILHHRKEIRRTVQIEWRSNNVYLIE